MYSFFSVVYRFFLFNTFFQAVRRAVTATATATTATTAGSNSNPLPQYSNLFPGGRGGEKGLSQKKKKKSTLFYY